MIRYMYILFSCSLAAVLKSQFIKPVPKSSQPMVWTPTPQVFPGQNWVPRCTIRGTGSTFLGGSPLVGHKWTRPTCPNI